MSRRRRANRSIAGDPSARVTGKPDRRKHDLEEVDYDSDQGPPPSTTTRLVGNWRLDPQASFSDWTIEILVQGVKHDTYHVHKQNLAVGPRKSEYFAKLFEQGGRFSEAKDSTSRIELQALAADAFPQLLDYMYFPERKLEINTNSATALYSLAKYFDMRCLRWEAKQFWLSDIHEPKIACGVYYEHAWLLNENKILEVAAESCSRQIMIIPTTSRLVHVPDPNFWLQIFEDKEISENCSCHLSMLIAEFALHNMDILNADMFHKLTDPQRLPIVDFRAALPLVDAERQIVQAPATKKLSGLQGRCINALAKCWSLIDTDSQSIAMNLIEKQNPFVISKILASTLSAARADTKQQSEELCGFHRLKPDTYDEIGHEELIHHDSLPANVDEDDVYGENVTLYDDEYVPLFYYFKP